MVVFRPRVRVIRTTVLIDEDGVVLDVKHKVKAKADPERVLSLL
jgi:peroxiredoxin